MKSITALWIALFSATFARAADWPQWMGPGRDNVWREEGLLEKFPEGGPTVVWRAAVAGGFAGPAVAEGKVFLTDFVTDAEVAVGNFERKSFAGTDRVLCLDEATGAELWKHEYPVEYTISYPAGPRSTPLVHEGKVYSLGAEGDLLCFEAESGGIVWSKDLKKEYGTKAALWGYAAHPLLDGRKLITLVGGEGSHAVAFDKDSGEELWRTLSAPEQGYSPPTIIEAGGVRQLILLRPGAISAVDPETGREYWSVPYEATSNSIIMSPVQSGEYLYAGGYSNKGLLLRLAADRPAAEVVWRDKPRSGIAPVNVQPIAVRGTLYGFSQNGLLYGVALPSGERLWETAEPVARQRRDSATAFLVKQADRFWLFNENGEIVMAKLSPAGYEEIDRAKVIEPTYFASGRNVVWSAPAYANRRMIVRNDEECICVDLAAN